MTAAAIVPPGQGSSAPESHEKRPITLIWRKLRKDRVAMVSLVIIATVVLTAVFAPLLIALVGHDPTTQNFDTGLTAYGAPVGPNSEYLLGTDQLGRDVLSRLIQGSRVSLGIGVGATLIALVIGLVVGTVSGYVGGQVDNLLSRLMDVTLSFPVLLFVIALVARFGPSAQLTLFVIASFSWPAIGRIVRGQVLSLKEREFVDASRSIGSGHVRIMVREILPNLIAVAVTYATLLIPANIAAEATLSYLGLGIVPPTPSWGNMIADSQSGNLYTIAWWFLVFPAVALFLTTLAFNLLGDSLRDALDSNTSHSKIG